MLIRKDLLRSQKTKNVAKTVAACVVGILFTASLFLPAHAANAVATKNGNSGTVEYTGDYYYNPKYVSVFLYNASGAAISAGSNSVTSGGSVSATKSAFGTHSVYGIGYEIDYITGEVAAYKKSNRAY